MPEPYRRTAARSREPEIRYQNGLALLVRPPESAPPRWMCWDARADAWVAPGHRFPELRAWAAERAIAEAAPATALDAPLLDPRHPRPYQREALDRWRAAGRRGSVVLPTGSGKSFVAALAIDEVARGACVVAPTRALVAQWFALLADAFGAMRVGAFYADEKDIRPITVTTYASAFRVLERWGAAFELLVLDEAHHLADAVSGEPRAWHDALEIAPAAYRLGLTATYPDGRDRRLRQRVGPVVYRKAIAEMADAELAGFAVERRFVALTPEERERYDRLNERYESFFAARGYRERFPDAQDAWRVFLAETRSSPAARRAHQAFRERERVVTLAAAKLAEAARLLRLFPAERAILFCGSTAAADRVSRELAIPMISAATPASERKALLDAIEAGDVRAVASVRVLDEGWDVPAAKLGIVLGDTTRGGRRQHVQRLGRLLRRQGDAVASLFEIVAAGTYEFFASQKRGAGLRRVREDQLGLGF